MSIGPVTLTRTEVASLGRVAWEPIVTRYQEALAIGAEKSFDPLEIARAVGYMMFVLRFKYSDVRERFSPTLPISVYIRLLQLHPDAQKLLEPSREQRLSVRDAADIVVQSCGDRSAHMRRALNLMSAARKYMEKRQPHKKRPYGVAMFKRVSRARKSHY
jgi:hypothetical protein